MTPLAWIAEADDDEAPSREFRRPYFHLGRTEWQDLGDGPSIEWQLTYGAWIRLFRSNGFEIEELIELRPAPDARTTYDISPLDWARDFPSEHIWKVRKA